MTTTQTLTLTRARDQIRTRLAEIEDVVNEHQQLNEALTAIDQTLSSGSGKRRRAQPSSTLSPVSKSPTQARSSS